VPTCRQRPGQWAPLEFQGAHGSTTHRQHVDAGEGLAKQLPPSRKLIGQSMAPNQRSRVWVTSAHAVCAANTSWRTIVACRFPQTYHQPLGTLRGGFSWQRSEADMKLAQAGSHKGRHIQARLRWRCNSGRTPAGPVRPRPPTFEPRVEDSLQ